MANDDAELIAYIASGGKLDAESELPRGYRGELLRLMTIFVDSELAGAAGFADLINRAPGMRERALAAHIVAEKLDHAETVLTLMERFGVNTTLYVREHAWDARLNRDIDLGNRRVGGDKRLNVLHYPLEGWIDAVAMNLLMGTATSFQIAEFLGCSYQPLADAMVGIVETERHHAQYGESGTAQSIERGGKAQAQASIDYWYPRVAATFGRLDSDRFDMYRQYGLRKHDNAALRRMWDDDIAARLKRLGLTVPKAT